MPSPLDAYRSGYEKAKTDRLGGMAAEVTMGMLRDDPGGHFNRGYQDGAAGKAFNPPSTPVPNRRQTGGLIPKFSENPFGWFLGVLIVIEFWALWQLIKAPFELVGTLMRSEKPSPSVIVRNVIVAGLAIALVWWVPHVNEMRGPASYTQAPPPFRQDIVWAKLDSAVTARANLVPRFAEFEKGYAQQPAVQQVLTLLDTSRAAVLTAHTPKDKLQANEDLSAPISQLIVIIEGQPALKSNANYLKLQDEFSGCENQIAVELRKYLELVPGDAPTKAKGDIAPRVKF